MMPIFKKKCESESHHHEVIIILLMEDPYEVMVYHYLAILESYKQKRIKPFQITK